MTRENKLALIVAFALILGVSVLLSDHLSSARSASPGEVRETTRLPAVPERPIRTLDDVARDARRPATTPPSGSTGAANDPGPVLASSNAPAGDSLIESLLSGLVDAPGALSPERTPVREPRAQEPSEAPLVLHQAIARGDPAANPRRGPDSTTPGTTRPVRSHSVRPGDSLFSIAAQYYGDGSLWRDLARFNADRVKADGTVNAGVSLRIPDRADLTGRPAVTQPDPAAPTAPATPPRQPSRSRTYTVASGDTLGEISQRSLGTSRRWREIYDLNKDRISDPDNVRAGTVLVLPAS